MVAGDGELRANVVVSYLGLLVASETLCSFAMHSSYWAFHRLGDFDERSLARPEVALRRSGCCYRFKAYSTVGFPSEILLSYWLPPIDDAEMMMAVYSCRLDLPLISVCLIYLDCQLGLEKGRIASFLRAICAIRSRFLTKFVAVASLHPESLARLQVDIHLDSPTQDHP